MMSHRAHTKCGGAALALIARRFPVQWLVNGHIRDGGYDGIAS